MSSSAAADGAANNPALAPDTDAPAGEGLELAQFAAGCFWSVELVYQRLPGVARTEVGYSQGHSHEPTYKEVCGHGTGHAEVVRVHYETVSFRVTLRHVASGARVGRGIRDATQRAFDAERNGAYDPRVCPYAKLLDVFWAKINPTTLKKQGKDVGTQYRSGIYYYTAEQKAAAEESLAEQQKRWEEPIVTEILPVKRFYPAEEYHQRYLEKGGQSAEKGCADPIRCYG